MIIQTLSRGQAQELMKKWVDNYPELPEINDEYKQLRIDIQTINKKVREEINNSNSINKVDYYLDYRIGLLIYEYFSNQVGFSMRVAADDGFWRFLSVKIVPDVVAQRWGKDNDSHFWSKPSRIWFRSLWWYVHLAWQGTIESTEKVLSSKHFSTDTILNLEERTGRNGTYVETYRKILLYYSKVPENELKKSKRGKGNNSDDIFRTVMKLNTAKMMVMDPSLFMGGEEAYAKSLFMDAGVTFDAS